MSNKDPYLDFLNTDSLLFSSSTKPLGKDPLKFSDPLSFGLNDPLSFGSSDKKTNDKKDKDDLDRNDFDAESHHSGDDDASAPPMDYLGYIQGYETTCFETLTIPPPVELLLNTATKEIDIDETPADATTEEAGENTAETKEPELPALNPVNLSDQEARTSLLGLVSTHCCWGSGVVKQMCITSMDYVPAYHYELQTFAEKRETNWVCGPHKGLDMDSATSGRAPLPWEIDLPPSNMFKEEVRVVTVPHTGVVKTCHKCRGNGGMTCGECYGKGWMRCLHCHGGEALQTDGHSLARDRCYYCQHSKYGHGRMECEKCQARGKVNCSTCEGTTHIRSHIQLSVSWRLVTSEHISTKLNIPENLIRNVSGQVAFEEEFPKVEPVTAFKEETIKMASAQLVSSHSTKFPEEKILRQRHQVRVVPVTKVNYEWKGKTRSFFVYGYENKVYLPNNSYPQAYCWGCNIM